MADTLVGIFLESCDRFQKPDQFMRRRNGAWESIPFARTMSDVESLSLVLAELGVKTGSRVALIAESRYEWPVADLAVLGLGGVTVPIYPTLIPSQIALILSDAETQIAIVSTAVQREKLRTLAPSLPRLETIITMEAAPGQDPALTFEGLLERGRKLRAKHPTAYRDAAAKLRADDLATIIYTSGTTGNPKGAMLTHGNIVSDCRACLEVVPIGPTEVTLSFLPLNHIFERMAGLYSIFMAGGTIAYAESIDSVAANAVEVRPTILNGVPRFYEKVHARVMENAGKLSPLQRRIFQWGLNRLMGRARAHFEGRADNSLLTALADRLVAHKIRERVGGRLRYCISGGAALPPHVLDFFFAVGITVLEGYGLTETSPVITLNPPGHEKRGSVGLPIPGAEVRIGDQGEILTRGPNVFMGYLNNEEATREALRDGWFHTGDIGRLDADGYLYVTDRLKDLIVTACGKKVAPQPLEVRLKQSPIISEAVLLGDQRPFIVALLIPEFPALEAAAREHGWSFQDHAGLLASTEVRALYQTEIDRLNNELSQYERVKRFTLIDAVFSPETGELTPSLKVRRKIVMEKYAPIIENMYEGHA